MRISLSLISTLYAGPVVALAPTCYVVWQNLVLSYLSARIKTKDLNPE
ncbi:MAG: hypothetical protein IJ982_10735 [Fibrobacter sp.]|nr:hypothetical protein [Fibrobacter sp.]